MAINIRVYPQYSPRVIEILAPTTTASIQEIINATRAWEDTTIGMNYPTLIDASGKEDLGGSVSVGITAELQNARVVFEQRNTVLETGSITANEPVGQSLIKITDSTATFATNLVQPGDVIWNTSDLSRATILSVDSETELTVFPLGGGTSNTWTNTDTYKIFQEITGEINGGNLVAVDDVDAQLNAFFPSAGTSITRTSSSSATLQEQADIQFASFEGAVTVDLQNTTGRAQDSSVFPAGTLRQPCLTQDNLYTITQANGIYNVRVLGDITLSDAYNWDGYIFIGESTNKTTITINPSVSVLNCEFETARVTGTLDGNSVIVNGEVDNLNFVDGQIEQCTIGPGNVSLGTGVNANFFECYSSIPGTTAPIIDMNNTGILALRNYYGGIKLTNYNGSGEHSIDLSSGRCILDNTITGGTFVVRGVGRLVDTSGNVILSGTWNGGVTIINETTGTTDKRIEELYRINNLEKGTPVTATPDSIIAGDITIDITGDGEDLSIGTRQ